MGENEKTISIPLGLNETPAQPAQDQRPGWAKKSIHNVKMSRVIQPAEPPPQEATPGSQSYDALQQQMGDLTFAVSALVQDRFGGGQGQPQAQEPQQPDPTMYDFYDPQSAAEYHRLNNQYIEATVQKSLAPHRDTLQSAELNRQYNSTLARFGNDENFQSTMDTALKVVARSGGKIDIPSAYEAVRADQNVEPEPEVTRDPRTGRFVRKYEERSKHLPSGLRKINGLGQLMQFHEDKRSGKIS